MRLWACPNGCPAVRGPERPRRNATVRFCLACSARSATLVERVAPALERRRDQRAAAAAERRTARRQRDAERRDQERIAYPAGWLRAWRAHVDRLSAWPRPVDHVEMTVRAARHRRHDLTGHVLGRDVVDTYGRIWEAGTPLRGTVGSVAERVVIDHGVPAQTSGRAYGDRFALTAGTDRSDALAILLHELAHCAAGIAAAHGDEWRSVYACAAAELTGRPVEPAGWTIGDLDTAVRAAIQVAGLDRVDDPARWPGVSRG